MSIENRKRVKTEVETVGVATSTSKKIELKFEKGFEFPKGKALKLDLDLVINPDDFKSFIASDYCMNKKLSVSMSLSSENKVKVLLFNMGDIGTIVSKGGVIGNIYLT